MDFKRESESCSRTNLGNSKVSSSFFLQLGVALGFVIPVSVVANQKLEENIHLIGEDLYNMFLTVAVLTTVLFIVIVIGEFQTDFIHE